MKTASERRRSVVSDWTSRTARKRRIDRSGSEPREQRAPDALRQEEDEGHEDRADHERPGLGEDREAVLQDEERGGANEGAEEGSGAAEQRHDHDLPRGRPVERLDRHDVEPERVERAGEPREEGREDEGEVLHPADVVAARRGAPAVLADRLEHGPERRVEDALERRHGECDEPEGEVVEGERGVQRDRDPRQPERRHVDPPEPVVAARPIGQMEADEIQELGEGERQHREVDAAPPQAEEADRRPAEDREPEPRPEREPERAHLELGERDARAVGAEPPVGRVAEGEKPRVAVEEVEAQGEEAVDQDLRRERLVRHDEREHCEDDDEGDDRTASDPAREDRRGPVPLIQCALHSIRPASPKSPLGRTRRTSAITMKTMISANFGAKSVVRLTTSPITMPATMAPTRLPIPPTTTTTNDSMTIVTPISA